MGLGIARDGATPTISTIAVVWISEFQKYQKIM